MGVRAETTQRGPPSVAPSRMVAAGSSGTHRKVPPCLLDRECSFSRRQHDCIRV